MLIEKWVFCVRLILQISAGANLITANDQLHLSSWAVCFLLWDWYTDTGGPLGPGGIKDKFWGLPIAYCLLWDWYTDTGGPGGDQRQVLGTAYCQLPIVGMIYRHTRAVREVIKDKGWGLSLCLWRKSCRATLNHSLWQLTHHASSIAAP